MADVREGSVPLASAAAWSPTAAPQPAHENRVLTLPDDAVAAAGAPPGAGSRTAAGTPAAGAPAMPPAADLLGTLRDVARRLRSAPESEATLQFVIDSACACTGSDAAVLGISEPAPRQFVCGSALGAGPYLSVPLRAGGPSYGELVLTRLSERAEYGAHEQAFAELVAEYVARAIAAQRAGTVLTRDEQDFVDRVTQELRAPLAGAVSTLDAAIGSEGLGYVARGYVTAALTESRRLLATMDDLSCLAHLREPDPRDMQAVPVGPWLERAVDAMQPDAQARGVALSLHLPAEALVVAGVPRLLDIVTAQLIGNAVKFTEAGGRVDVTADLVDDAVRVSVRDTGIGFDAAEAPRMTECFTRALSADAARIPGLGVGLFLADRIVRDHHGRLWLESDRDEGTHAHVALPRRVAGA